MRTLKQIDLTSRLVRPLYGEEIVRVEDGAGTFLGYYSYSERTREWTDTGISGSISGYYYLPNFANVYPNSTTDSTAGINAAIASLQEGDTLDFGPYYYYINGTVKADKNANASCRNIRLLGRNSVSANISKTRIITTTADVASPILTMATTRAVVEGIHFEMRANRLSCVEVGKATATDHAINWIRFHNCSFEAASGGVEQVALVSIGGYLVNSGNLENTTFVECRFQGINNYGVACLSGQPYTTNFQDTSFFGSTLKGVAVYSHLYSSNFNLIGCDFQQLERWFDFQDCNFYISGPQSEHCKAIGKFAGSVPVAGTIIGGARINSGDFVGTASNGPAILASTYADYLDISGAVMLSVIGCNVNTNGGEQQDPRVYVARPAAVKILNCTVPGRDAFRTATGGTESASIQCENVFWFDGSARYPVRDLPKGTHNEGVEVAVYGSDTDAIVPFQRAEATTEYIVTPSVEVAAGTPAAGAFSAAISNKNTTYCKVKLGAAPGAGAGVLIRCAVTPQRKRYTTVAGVGTVFAHWRSDSGVTQAAGLVSSWVDSVNSHALTESTNKPGYTASNAALNALPSIDFTNSSMQLVATEAASVYAFVSNGSPCTVLVVGYNDNANATCYFGTHKSGSLATRGAELYIGPTSQALVYKGDGSTQNALVTAAETTGKRWACTADAGSSVANESLRFATGQNPVWTTPVVAAKASGDPEHTFKIQSTVTAGTFSVAEIIVWSTYVDQYQMQAFLNGYLRPRYAGGF